MSVRQGNKVIANAGGGAGAIDNLSITENLSNELQTVGVIDSRDTSTAIKTWTGTKQQYDAILTKDANTLYNITDDTDVSLTILEALYPVGSIYMTTNSSCPLQTLGVGTWTQEQSGIVVGTSAPCKGNGMALGLDNGSVNGGALLNSSGVLEPYRGNYGGNIGAANSGSKMGGVKAVGITTDGSKSGVVADLSSNQYSVNIFRRTA